MYGSCLEEHAGLQLRHHHARFSATIAKWVRSADHLRWLAPGTTPPLTALKVDGWANDGDVPMLYWHVDQARPVAYGELNRLAGHPRSWWIGHLIVDPARRGRGIGRRFAQDIVQLAFEKCLAEHLSLVVFPGNQHAISCYRKAGLAEDGMQTQRCGPRGVRARLLRMSLSRRRYYSGWAQCDNCRPAAARL